MSNPNPQETKKLNEVLPVLQNILAVVGGTTAITYTIGLIIIGIYLNQYGIGDLDFLSTRYISIGLAFIIYQVFIFIPVFYLVHYCLEDSSRSKTKIKKVVLTLLVCSLILGSYLCTVSPYVTRSMLIIGNVNDLITNFSSWLQYLERIGHVFYIVMISYCLIAFTAFFGISIFSESTMLLYKKFMVFVLITFIPLVGQYSLAIYPLISPSVGGGSAIKVQLITEAYDKLNELVPFEAGSKRKILPSCLLEQSSKYYFLAIPKTSNVDLGSCVPPYSFHIQRNKDIQVTQINRDLISGMAYILD